MQELKNKSGVQS